MDLAQEAERLRLDLLAVSASAALTGHGVPHVLLKGPSTANWLYDPPRTYRDVDLLVPLSRVETVVEVLAAHGIAVADAGGLGEVAPHSVILRSPEGFEVDVHVTLPTLPSDDDVVWDVLCARLVPLDLGVGTVPQLDEPARCLVLALHALNNLPGGGQAVEDLQRAWAVSSAGVWEQAAALARAARGGDLFEAGTRLARPCDGHESATTARAALHLAGAPGSAFGLERLASAPAHKLPALLWREFFPSRGFMRYADAASADNTAALMAAYVHRWRRLARELKPSIRAWHAARAGRRSAHFDEL